MRRPLLVCPWCSSAAQRQPVVSCLTWGEVGCCYEARCERCGYGERYTRDGMFDLILSAEIERKARRAR